jgi:ADP-L-glycero-D-manno-heptose 6-epimerase
MILVTGGAGFIGSVLVAHLNQQGLDDILVVDHLGNSKKWKNLTGLKFKDYLERDVFAQQLEKGVFKTQKFDCIFHLGACSSTTEKNATYLINNNFEYSKNMAKLAFDKKARFIYASSAATYGDGACGFEDDESKLDSLRPLNIYGYSKQVFDLWLQRNGLLKNAVGLKYFNVFGPNEYHKGSMASFIFKAFDQINATGKVKLFKSYHPDFEDGKQLRDFVYVKDAVKMSAFFMANPSINGIFNIATGRTESWVDLVNYTFKAMNLPSNIEFIDMPEELKSQYQYYTKGPVEKIRNSGYTEKITSLEDSIKDYVQNYLIGKKHI